MKKITIVKKHWMIDDVPAEPESYEITSMLDLGILWKLSVDKEELVALHHAISERLAK